MPQLTDWKRNWDRDFPDVIINNGNVWNLGACWANWWMYSNELTLDPGWPLTWKTWKNQGIPKWSRKSQGKWKKSGKSPGKWNQVCFFSSCKYSKTRFSVWNLEPTPKLGLCWGSLWCSRRPPSRLGRGTPHPFPQLFQPQLLNNWLFGLTLFFINMKQRLLTISVDTRYRVIFACLYWKSQGISCRLESGHPEDRRPKAGHIKTSVCQGWI